LVVGMWIASQRASARGLRVTALAFTLGVAGLALLGMVFPSVTVNIDNAQAYGFFANRNHNATLLAMGALVGLGCLTQAIRDKRAATIGMAAVATILSLWAALGWSLSRAGVGLVACGVLLWLVLLGPRYLGRQGRRALLFLAAAAVGGFLIAEPAVKLRIDETLTRSRAQGAEATPLEKLDFRIPTWIDTAAMIRQRPWTGFGPGQFVFVFPQYRDRTALIQNRKHLHPESDWLWLAAESGIPAAVALAGALGLAGISALRELGRGHARALRAACLVAALLLALHGLVDVPGHRVPLAWSAALLLGLSLRATSLRPGRVGRGLFRLGGLGVIALGVALAYAENATPLGPATTAGERAAATAVTIARTAIEAKATGEAPRRTKAEARAALTAALAVLPMDGSLHYLQGVSVIDLPYQMPATHRAFAIERALNPTGLKQPLRQAATWAPRSSHHAAELCKIARSQAARLDQHGSPPPDRFPTWAAAAEAQIVPLARRFPNLARRLGLPAPKRPR